MNAELFLRSVLLGAGLAMDAFSVSLADGLAEQDMKKRRMFLIAGTFALFQFAMPVAGWVLVKTAVSAFGSLEIFIPWIALLLLLYIGGKMLTEGVRESREKKNGVSAGEQESPEIASAEEKKESRLSGGDLFIQGVATSIDALSVGFTIEHYGLSTALISSAVIGIVTLAICLAGLGMGRKIGTRLSGRASIFGGVILICIGIEIWAKGLFF